MLPGCILECITYLGDIRQFQLLIFSFPSTVALQSCGNREAGALYQSGTAGTWDVGRDEYLIDCITIPDTSIDL